MTTRKQKGHYGRPFLRMRADVIESEPFCYLCGEWIDKNLHWLDDGAPQLHLVIPVSKGGSWRDRSNCRATHRICNRRQGNAWDGTVNHTRTEGPWIAGEEP